MGDPLGIDPTRTHQDSQGDLQQPQKLITRFVPRRLFAVPGQLLLNAVLQILLRPHWGGAHGRENGVIMLGLILPEPTEFACPNVAPNTFVPHSSCCDARRLGCPKERRGGR